MASDELLRYVEESLAKGHSRASIASHLEKAGWPRHEIDSAFGLVRSEPEPPLPAYSADAGHRARLFNLQEGENVVFEAKPLKGLFWYTFVPSFIILAVFFLFLGAILGNIVLIIGGVILAGLLSFVISKRWYNMRYYWITDKRIIVKRGFIGYSINSIPLERISDVMISRSLVERIFGFGSLHIQSLAGQYSMGTLGGKGGAEGNLEAIPDPEKNQEVIFRLVKEKRKTEHLTM